LDLSFWIKMTEEREPSYIKLKELLSKKVSDRKVICPVSPTLLVEFRKQPASEKLAKYSQLIDGFSQGLSIRNWHSLFKDEFTYITAEKKIESKVAYSHFADAFSSSTRLVFGQQWTEADLKKAGDIIFNHFVQMSVNKVFDIEMDENEIGNITFIRNRFSQLAEQEKAWRESHQDTRHVIEQAEFTATVNAVLPLIFSVLISATESSAPSFRNLTTTSLEDKKELLDRCSTFWCRYQLMTALRSNRAFLKENDLWDIEHAATVLPYVTCFACDGGTRHICSDVLRLDKRYGTMIVSKVDELIEFIELI